MSKNEYEKFYYNGKAVFLEDALTDDKKDLLSIYDKSSLYCPECHIAKLKFVRKTNKHRAFLSTKQASATDKNLHASNCSYSYEQTSNKQQSNYYTELSDEQIKDKLDAAINAYLRKTDINDAIDTETSIDDVLNIEPTTNSRKRIYRTLPRRSIYKLYNVEEELYGFPILFYGEVGLNCIRKANYYEIGIISLKTMNTIRRVRLFNLPAPIDDKKIYYLSMIMTISNSTSGNRVTALYDEFLPSIKYVPIKHSDYKNL